jgi:hypothetical protein
MTRQPGDNSPRPPGGGAAERQRQFLEARMTPEELAAELGEGGEAGEPENDHCENEQTEQEAASSADQDEEAKEDK